MKYIKPTDFLSVREFKAEYQRIEESITELLAEDASARTADELNKRLQSALNAAVKYLSSVNAEFAKKELATAFNEGKESSAKKAETEKPKLTVAQANEILAKQGYKYSKTAFANDLYIELQTATESAGKGLKSRVNGIIEQLRKDGKDSVYNVQEAIKKDLQENGLLVVEYANGAKQTLDTYASMAARSARIETTNIGAIGRALQAGTDLVRMTSMPQCCKFCGAFQDKVYSISGKDKRFPALFKTVLRSGYALPHPNCRHEFIPYFEEMEAPEDVERMAKQSQIKYDKHGNLVDVRSQADIRSYQAWQAGNRQRNAEYLEYKRMQQYYAGREKDMPYKTLTSFRTARRRDELSPAFKAWRYRKQDAKQYERWKVIVGEQYMPKTVDDFQRIKYNKSTQQEFEVLRQIREQEIDYKTAESGGAHSGKLVDYQKNFSIAALEKTVKNLDEKIMLHLGKINNPEQHYKDWGNYSVLQQEGYIKHWRKEISNFKKQKNIAIAVLRRRRDK